MNADPLVSVICTTRDASATIEMTLQSILQQTLRRWEMIVVDDGSSDRTPAIVEAYARREPRIQLVPTPGLGRGRALNMAVSCARAGLVANIDADDLSHPRRLELQYETMMADPEITLLCTGVLLIRRDERAVWPHFDANISHHGIVDVTADLVFGNPVMHASVMVRKADLLNVSGYAEDILSQFDYELWLRMAASGRRIHKLGLPLAAKRLHDRQSFERRRRVRYLYSSARIQSEAIRVCGAPRHYIFLVWARFLFGLLPSGLRGALRDLSTEPPRRRDPPWARKGVLSGPSRAANDQTSHLKP